MSVSRGLRRDTTIWAKVPPTPWNFLYSRVYHRLCKMEHYGTDKTTQKYSKMRKFTRRREDIFRLVCATANNAISVALFVNVQVKRGAILRRDHRPWAPMRPSGKALVTLVPDKKSRFLERIRADLKALVTLVPDKKSRNIIKEARLKASAHSFHGRGRGSVCRSTGRGIISIYMPVE